MTTVRSYGDAPFDVAVIHGGPGAAGEVAPVARELASTGGVLEPIQTATSVAGQVAELRAALEAGGDCPVSLVGYSWGAWLSFMLAAEHPTLVRKLVLVSSGPFEQKYVAALQEARTSRLSPAERIELDQILTELGSGQTSNNDRLLARLRGLCSKTDDFDPVQEEPEADDAFDLQGRVYQSVWEEAAELRKSGWLLAQAEHIRCPVVAIHGDYDPHPAAGVQEPLSRTLHDFRFILLPQCGHKPWIERRAAAEFYLVLKRELGR